MEIFKKIVEAIIAAVMIAAFATVKTNLTFSLQAAAAAFFIFLFYISHFYEEEI